MKAILMYLPTCSMFNYQINLDTDWDFATKLFMWKIKKGITFFVDIWNNIER